MKKVVRLSAFLISVLMLLSVLSGCGSKKDSKGADNASGNTAAERFKYVWAAPSDTGGDDQNTMLEQELEKVFTDIDFVFWSFARNNYEDQLAMRIAGGEVPDVMRMLSTHQLKKLAEQNVLAEIPLNMIQKNAPGYYKIVQDAGVVQFLVTNQNGKNYGLPVFNPAQLAPNTDGWRMDWLKNVGITKVPETLDEMEEAFKRFVNDDPDKNGKKDTYGICPVGKTNTEQIFGNVFAAYGVYGHKWMLQPDGTIKLGILMPQAKEALARLNKWYKAGYIDPEFITTDQNTKRKKFYNGRIGYYDNDMWQRLMPNGLITTSLKAVTPSAEIALAPPVKGPNGSYGYSGWSGMGAAMNFKKSMEKDTRKMERILQVIEKLTMDEKLYHLTGNGMEGVHWNRDQFGAVAWTKDYETPDKRMGLGLDINIRMVNPSFQSKDLGTEVDKYAIYSKQSSIKVDKDYFEWLELFVDADPSKLYYDQLRPVVAKWMINFITGSQPIDNFDQFLKEWSQAGGDKVTEGWNRAYQEGKKQLATLGK